MAADCVRSQGGSSRVKARYSCRNKRERAPPLDAPKLTIFSFLHTRPLFFLLFDTALSPFRLRSATFRSIPAPFRSVPAPFRSGRAARVLRSVPRAGRHYTRARARCAAPFAPLHYARRACGVPREATFRYGRGGTRSPFRSASGAALHSRARSLRRPVRSTPLRPQGVCVRRHYTRARARCAAARPRPTPAFRSVPRVLRHYTRFARCACALAPLHEKRVRRPSLRSTTPPAPPRAPSTGRYVPRVRRHYTRFARCVCALAPLHAQWAPPPPPPPRKLLRYATQIARRRGLPSAPLRLHYAPLRLHYAPLRLHYAYTTTTPYQIVKKTEGGCGEMKK